MGSPTAVGEPEVTGATFGGPVNAGGPADGGPANAGEPDVVPDADGDHNEPDDAAQPMDDDDEEPAEGGSSNDEEPGTPWGSLRTQRRDTDSEVEVGFDVYVPDLHSDDSEYGSYFYASNSMPPVENLTPGAFGSGMNLNVSHFLSEESMSEPRVLIYHEWLLAHEWHHCHCISDRVWCILQDYEPHSDAIHEFPEVHRRPESLSTALCLSWHSYAPSMDQALPCFQVKEVVPILPSCSGQSGVSSKRIEETGVR